jgi:hypothetical protein
MKIIVKCFDVDNYALPDNRMLEVPSNINYKSLQELVNKKYDNIPIQMHYIDENEDQITVDSDLVLQKAMQHAVKVAYQGDDKDVTLRLLIHKLPSGKTLLINNNL